MIAGGARRSNDGSTTFAKFSAISALSATNSVPFDIDEPTALSMMGEESAQVIGPQDGWTTRSRPATAYTQSSRGMGASSDGRGKRITAPSQGGQALATMPTARAGYPVSSVELIEAHGYLHIGRRCHRWHRSPLCLQPVEPAGHRSGGLDKVADRGTSGHVGLAGILKASLSLHHRTNTPSAGFEQPNETVPWSEVPFYVPTVAGDWPKPTIHAELESARLDSGERISTSPSSNTILKNTRNSQQSGDRKNTAIQSRWRSPSTDITQLGASKALEGGVLLVNGNSEEALLEGLCNDAYLRRTVRRNPDLR